jgi:hypothetical protein
MANEGLNEEDFFPSENTPNKKAKPTCTESKETSWQDSFDDKNDDVDDPCSDEEDNATPNPGVHELTYSYPLHYKTNHKNIIL